MLVLKKSALVSEQCHTKLKEITEKTGIKIYKLLDEATEILYKKYISKEREHNNETL